MVEKKVAISLNLLLNELKNFKVDSLASAPKTVTDGRMYFNTVENTLYYGADDKWNPIATGGSVKDTLDKLKLSLKPDSEREPTKWNLNLSGTEASVDVTNMMKDSSVVRIVSFLPSEGNNPSAGRVSGIYNEEQKTFTLTGTSTKFQGVDDKNQVYLGLILDNYGGQFGNISNRYVGLAISADSFNGINTVSIEGEDVPLSSCGTLDFRNTDEVTVSNPSTTSGDIEFSIGEISAEKIIHKDWNEDPGEDSSTTEDTNQEKINEVLRDNINGIWSTLSELSLEIDTGKMYFTHGDGDKLNENGFDVSDFLKDGMLLTVTQTFTAKGTSQEVTAQNGETYTFTGLKSGTPYIGFVWETREGGTQMVPLDVTDLFNAYKAGNGISLSSDTFSIKMDSNSEKFLSVDSGSLKLSGVQDAINKVAITHKSKSVSITDENITGSQAFTPDDGNEIDPRSVRAFFWAAGPGLTRLNDEIGVAVSYTPAMIADGVVQKSSSMYVSWSNCPLGTLTIFYDEYSR